MIAMVRKERFVFVFLIIFLGCIGRGHACSCLPTPPVDEAFESSNLVFLGKVTQLELTKEVAPGSPPAAILVTIKAQEVFKGTLYKGKYDESFKIRTGLDSALCGYSFYIAQAVLVYAYDVAEEGYVGTHICTRTSDAVTPQAQQDLEWLRSNSQ